MWPRAMDTWPTYILATFSINILHYCPGRGGGAHHTPTDGIAGSEMLLPGSFGDAWGSIQTTQLQVSPVKTRFGEGVLWQTVWLAGTQIKATDFDL